MDQKKRIDVSKISNIFANMSYGENNYDTERALEWFKHKNILHSYIDKSNEGPNGIPIELENILTSEKLCAIHISEIDTIKQILVNSKKDIKWADTPAIARSKILYSLGREIEKSSDLFADIELVLRGIIPRETKNNVIPLLVQYFYYYSIFAVSFNHENSNWKPPGVSVGVISNENVLSNLGLYLAPALAAGYNVILQVGTKIAPLAFLILELAKKVGIGEDVIRIIPSDDGELLPYFNSDNVAMITLFADIHNGKYRGINQGNKKVLAMCPSPIPILVCENADLDSACEAIVSMVWNSSNSIMWSKNCIFVQENIMPIFLNKLKNKLRKVKIGSPNDKKVDIVVPKMNSICKFNDFLKSAEEQGYDIFRRSCSSWSPVLLIGSGTHLKISDDEEGMNGTIGVVVPFRSTEEAISLINNLKHGLGVSIWTENVKVIGEIAKKIETTNVWVNKPCKFAADISFSPMKKSGFGYFGGIEGFYEYVEIGAINVGSQAAPIASSVGTSNALIKLVDNAKKAQASWKNTENLHRISIFQKVVEYLEENKLKLSDSKEKQIYDSWISATLESLHGITSGSSNQFEGNKNITVIHVPRGVIVMDIKKMDELNMRLILRAIFEGNALIVLHDSGSICTALSKLFPTGVLNSCSEVDAIGTISGRQDINIFAGAAEVNPVFTHLPAHDGKVINYSRADISRKVTLLKNIWN